MGGQAVRWTAEQVRALAPDDASRRAGSKLSAPGPWTEAGWGNGALWGQCKGSGSKPYQTVVDLDGGQGPGYRCSCPSRKFPCKHALGLLLLWAGGEAVVAEGGDPPEWADGWLGDRRRRAERKAARGPAGAPEGTNAGQAAAGTGNGADERARAEAAHRRAAQRAERITAGTQELEQRLADLLRGGLAGAEQRGYAPWEEMAARMVDAQAPGLAARIRELGAIPGSGEGWPGRLLAECALLHLLAVGWRRAAELPAPLADTVRTRVGLTLEAADLLSDKQALVRDEWLVLAQRDADEGRLTVRRVWLYGRSAGRHALLLSYGAGGRAPELALPVGAALDAELAYYPGSGSLRAALGPRYGAPLPGFQPPGTGVREALEGYARMLREDPWAEGRPCVLERVVPVPPSDAGTAGGTAGASRGGAGPGAAGWHLAAADEEVALPVAPGTGAAALWRLLALSAEGPVTVFGECGHRGFAPHTAWHQGRVVPL
ncbi:SWIM zinc finger family protein [Streptomyces qinglanensis]|uniref:SWIM zinc finger family protein n=1 Tax=Streptomyces qinglanensis TaxID=943816 RepID=UPI00379A13BD